MAELSIVEAVNDCLHVELAQDGNVLVMGEDVGRSGGVFRATAGLLDRFGANRCVDTPLAEAGILGTAVGLCMAGWRPVCEMQYDAFSYPCLDQLITHVGRYHWRTGGAMEFPIVIRMPYGGGVRAPELHDDSPETYYVHTPGIKVAIPATPADAKGLLAAAIRDPDPVVILEPKLHYRTIKGEVPEGEYIVPLGQARLAREGTDLTLVAYGSMVPLCEQAADALDGEASVEILDIRSLKPLDEDALLASAAKTGRVVIVQEAPRVCGFAAELAAILAEKAILSVLAGRGRLHAVRRACARRCAQAARVLSDRPRATDGAAHAARSLLTGPRAGPHDRCGRLGAHRRSECGLGARFGRRVRVPGSDGGHGPCPGRADRSPGSARGTDARRADRRSHARLAGSHDDGVAAYPALGAERRRRSSR